MTDEFLREVDEDIKRDRLERLWQRYGRYFIAGVLAIVAATVAYVTWQQYELRQREALSDRYAAAIDSVVEGDREGAIAVLEALAAEAEGGYAALARLQMAALLADRGDLPKAIELYDQLTADRALAPALRDLATVLGALHAVEQEDLVAVEKRVANVDISTNPFRYTAREAVALAVLKSGDLPRAREMLRILADDVSSPRGVRGRAAELLAALNA